MGVLDGKAVVVTGAARGLGRAYALDAAKEGASVVVNDLDPDVETVAREIVDGGGHAVAQVGSVTSWDTAAEIIDECVRAFGRLDGLINNAGVIFMKSAEQETPEHATATVTINLLGAIFVGTNAMRVMAEQERGSIVNNTSSSQMGVPNLATYGATKGALATLTYCWAIDMEPFGVRVNGFSPSAFTRMSEISKNPVAQNAPSVESNVPAVTYLLSDLSDGITGQVIQKRKDELVIVQHPAVSQYFAVSDEWTAETVARELGPLLHEHAQPVGWAPSLEDRRVLD